MHLLLRSATHAYLDLSPASTSREAVRETQCGGAAAPGACEAGLSVRPDCLGSNTDPYQPIERAWKITRSIIAVLAECDHPVYAPTTARW